MIQQKDLHNALKQVKPIVGNNMVLEILSDFKLVAEDGVLVITATDLSVFGQATVSVDAEFAVCVPAELFFGTIASLPDQPLMFEFKGETMLVIASSGEYKIPTEPVEDFPTPKQLEGKEFELINLSTGLGKTMGFTGETKPSMQGVNIECYADHTNYVATNGHVLSKYNFEAVNTGTYEFLLPQKAASSLQNMVSDDPVSVTLTDSHVKFTQGNYSLTAILLEFKYVDYRRVMPKENPFKLIAARKELKTTLSRVSRFSSDTQVNFDITSDFAGIRAFDTDLSTEANEKINCEYKGDPINVTFDSKYLQQLLGNTDEEFIEITLKNPQAPVLIVEENLTQLIMPINPLLNTKK